MTGNNGPDWRHLSPRRPDRGGHIEGAIDSMPNRPSPDISGAAGDMHDPGGQRPAEGTREAARGAPLAPTPELGCATVVDGLPTPQGFVRVKVDDVTVLVPVSNRSEPVEAVRRTPEFTMSVIPQVANGLNRPLNPFEEETWVNNFIAEIKKLFPGSRVDISDQRSFTSWGLRGMLCTRFSFRVVRADGQPLPTEADFKEVLTKYPMWAEMNALRESYYPRGLRVPSEAEDPGFYRAIDLWWGSETKARLSKFSDRVAALQAQYPGLEPNLLETERRKLLPGGYECLVQSLRDKKVELEQSGASEEQVMTALLRVEKGFVDNREGTLWHRAIRNEREWREFCSLYDKFHPVVDAAKKAIFEINAFSETELRADHARAEALEAMRNPLYHTKTAMGVGLASTAAAALAGAYFLGPWLGDAMGYAGGANTTLLTPFFATLGVGLGLSGTLRWLRESCKRWVTSPRELAIKAVDPFPVLASLRALLLTLRREGKAYLMGQRFGVELEEGMDGVQFGEESLGARKKYVTRQIRETIKHAEKKHNSALKMEAEAALGNMDEMLRRTADVRSVMAIGPTPAQQRELDQIADPNLRRAQREIFARANRKEALMWVVRWEKPEPLQIVLDPRIPVDEAAMLISSELDRRDKTDLIAKFASIFARTDGTPYGQGVRGFFGALLRKGEDPDKSFGPAFKAISNICTIVEKDATGWSRMDPVQQSTRLVAVQDQAKGVPDFSQLLWYKNYWGLVVIEKAAYAGTVGLLIGLLR